jgi:hypothetical protein
MNFAAYLQQQVESTGPETEYERVEMQVRADEVRKEDQLLNNASLEVKARKTGTKWTELFDFEGGKIMRVLNDTTVTVLRKQETKGSAVAYELWWRETKLAKRFTTDPRDVFMAEVQKFNEHIANDYQLDYTRYGAIMEAQEKYTLERRIRQSLEHQYTEEGKTLVEAWNAFVEHIRLSLTEGYGGTWGISRSSNQVSNLIEDVQRQVLVEFCREAKWY